LREVHRSMKPDHVKEAEQAYKQLADSQKRLAQATKLGDNDGINYWQGQISNIGKVIEEKRRLIDTDTLSAEVQGRLAQVIQKCDDANLKHVDTIQKIEAKKHPDYLKQIEASYRELVRAQQEYIKANNMGDKSSADHWMNSIRSIEANITKTREQINLDDEDENKKRQIEDAIRKCEDAQSRFNASVSAGTIVSNELEKTYQKMTNTLKIISGISLVKIWNDALRYAKE